VRTDYNARESYVNLDNQSHQNIDAGLEVPTHTLYVCYFGLREPLVQTQVLPYLRELVAGDIRVSLLTFEPEFTAKWTAAEVAEQKQILAAEKISWHYLKYHKRPTLPATLFDIAAGTRFILRIMKRDRINVLHARNHVPAIMCALARKVRPAKLVFDIRGFMPEEYTDAGVWPANGYLYRGLKRVERYLFRIADAFVVLTEKARQILFPGCTDADNLGRPIEMIPCCVDLSAYETARNDWREAMRQELNLEGRRVIAYVGSFGGWYLTKEIIEFLAAAHRRDPTVFSMILTQSPRELVIKELRDLGIGEQDFFVAKVNPREVPRYLSAADAAISFIKACYSKQSSSPTKIAEYLAAGLPVIANTGVGDIDQLLTDYGVGILLSELNEAGYQRALDELNALLKDETISARCLDSARMEFDLRTVGGPRYRRLYRRLQQVDQSPRTKSAR
jgi:glycosyltransferase involved in cell wall biosynthesis